MKPKRQLFPKQLEPILQATDIQALSREDVAGLFEGEMGIAKFAPDGICQVDPRNGERVIFNSARARRPHDNRPGDALQVNPPDEKDCAICQGKTTSVVDVADLSDGFTFINKNLFPILFPSPGVARPQGDTGEILMNSRGIPAEGMHFLQWTSSIHDRDWHNMPLGDRVVVVERLAVLESSLLGALPQGYVSTIKNYGRLVGGSLVHGHQQICLSNVMPRRYRQNRDFGARTGETFTTYLLKENPADFILRDYGPAVLLVPYFMRRPFDMFLVIKDASKSDLHALNLGEIEAVAQGWQDAIRVMMAVMPRIGRETAFNVAANTGPGAGIYFEFLPYTQELGGFEHLGLFLCQGNPGAVASQVREMMSGDMDAAFA